MRAASSRDGRTASSLTPSGLSHSFDVRPAPDERTSRAPFRCRERPAAVPLSVHPLLDVLPRVAYPLSDVRNADEFGIEAHDLQPRQRRREARARADLRLRSCHDPCRIPRAGRVRGSTRVRRRKRPSGWPRLHRLRWIRRQRRAQTRTPAQHPWPTSSPTRYSYSPSMLRDRSVVKRQQIPAVASGRPPPRDTSMLRRRSCALPARDSGASRRERFGYRRVHRGNREFPSDRPGG